MINPCKHAVKWDEKCASKFQFNVKQFFKNYWKNCLCYEEFPVYPYGRYSPSGKAYRPLRLDLFNLSKKIAVESSHEQHYKKSDIYHRDMEDFAAGIYRDIIKKNWCEHNEILLIEIYPDDLPLTVEKINEIACKNTI